MSSTLRVCASIIITIFSGAHPQVWPNVHTEVPAFAPYMSIPNDFGPSWSPDERIVYASKAGAGINLYVISLAAAHPVSSHTTNTSTHSQTGLATAVGLSSRQTVAVHRRFGP
jgi:hypothetical protein